MIVLVYLKLLQASFMIDNDSTKTARIPELDGIRGLAVLMVVLWHYVACQVQDAGIVSKIILASSKLLWSGVDLFFVLSGFLIGGILLKNKNSGNYFKAFYIRRIARIFPLYYLLIFLYLLFFCFDKTENFPWLTENLMPLGSYLTFTQNYFMGELATYGGNWFAITWSLAIEEQFYLLLPLLVFVLPVKKFPYVLIFAIVLALIMRLTIHNFHSFVSLLCRMDSLMIGVCLAYINTNDKCSGFITANKKKVYAAFSVFLLGLVMMHFKGFGPFKTTWLAFTYAFLILIAIYFKESKLSAFMRNKWLGQIGIVSYGIYIFHQLVSGILHQLILDHSPQITGINDALVTVLSFILTVVISLLLFRYYEAPFLKIGQRYSY